MEKNCKTCAYNKNNKNSVFYNHNEKHCKGYDCYILKKKFDKAQNKCDKYVIDIVNFSKNRNK